MEEWSVKNTNDSFSKVEVTGNVRVCLLDTDGKEQFVTLANCLFLPDHAQNLISVDKLSQKVVNFEFGKKSQLVAPIGTTFSIIKSENLYFLKAKILRFLLLRREKTNTLLCHRRLGHG